MDQISLEKKTLLGVKLFGWGIILTSLMHMQKLIGDHDLYLVYYKSWGIFGYIRYWFSWFQRIVGISVGIGLLYQMNWARVTGMILGSFTILTIYWKHPYEPFLEHTKYLDDQILPLIRQWPLHGLTFESMTVASIVVHCLLDVLFWAVFIYYMTRPQVRRTFRSVIKGIHYRNPHVYEAITHLLLGKQRYLRFEIAAAKLAGSGSVVDLCAGTGRLKEYLPAQVKYMALDASPEFISVMKEKKINCQLFTLEQAENQDDSPGTFDAAVMVISLCQARALDMDRIIAWLKKIARKCVIIEDVKARKGSLRGRLMNYFCGRAYYKPCKVFTRQEFEELTTRHGFVVSHYDERYSCAIYEPS